MNMASQQTLFDAVERAYPKAVRAKAPPIKSQGIKTKLAPAIFSSFRWGGNGTWIEPFVGSGAVAFNSGARSVLAADSNKHLIQFYQAVQGGRIDARTVRKYLEAEGAKLLAKGEDHYYRIRDRFNKNGDPLDFLFLSRSCFNGMIRFNRKGEYNVPFCRKPHRFQPALITKIANQVAWLETVIRSSGWVFFVQDWRETLACAGPEDFVYVDPPYVGRHSDYFDSWSDTEADALANVLRSLPCGFAYSMWSRNRYRENEHMKRWFADYHKVLIRHFYHIGPTEDLRNEMEEAIIVSPGSVVF